MSTLSATTKHPRGVVPCKGPCGRPTRSKGMPPIEGTVLREGRGMCFVDYKAAIRAEKIAAGKVSTRYALTKCTKPGCEAMTRHQYEPTQNVEGLGTRRRMESGECFQCYKKAQEEVPPETVENTRKGLDAFIARRKARQERMARLELVRAQRTYGLAS